MSHTRQQEQEEWHDDDEEEDEVVYDRSTPTECDPTRSAIDAFHAHTHGKPQQQRQPGLGQPETTTATMNHAVRVPYALQGAGRRTMYDVLLSLHKEPQQPHREEITEQGDTHKEGSTVDERRGLMHLLPSHRAEKKQGEESDEDEAQQRALGISDFSDSETEQESRPKPTITTTATTTGKEDAMKEKHAAPHTVSSLLDVMEGNEVHGGTRTVEHESTIAAVREKRKPERSVLDLFHDEEQMHATQQQQQQSRRSTKRPSGRRVDELVEEPPMISQRPSSTMTGGHVTQRPSYSLTQGTTVGQGAATQGTTNIDTLPTSSTCLGKPEHLVLHSFASRQESGRLSSSSTGMGGGGLIYAARPGFATGTGNSSAVMMMTLASQGLAGPSAVVASPMVWTPAYNNNTSNTQGEREEKDRGTATREAARRRSWRLLLKDNPTALRVVEYAGKRFALWTPRIAALAHPSRSVSLSPHSSTPRKGSKERDEVTGDVNELTHCGVDVQAVVVGMDTAYSLVRLIVTLRWVSPSAAHLLPLPSTPKTCWSLFLTEQVYLATTPQLHEHVYLAPPYSVYREARSIIASYCVTSDALVAQQVRLQQHLRRSLEREEGPGQAREGTPVHMRGGSQPGSLRATPVKTRQMFSAHKPSASPARPSGEAEHSSTTTTTAVAGKTAEAATVHDGTSATTTPPQRGRQSVSSEVTPFRAGFYDPLAHPGNLGAHSGNNNEGEQQHANTAHQIQEGNREEPDADEDRDAELPLFSQATHEAFDPIGEDFPAGPDEAWEVPLETLMQLAGETEAVSTQQARANTSPSPLSSPDV